MKYNKEHIKELTGEDIDSDYGYIEVLSEKQYKGREISNLFRSLLDMFWNSGLSSFPDKNLMRNYYKEKIGLIEVMNINKIPDDLQKLVMKSVNDMEIEDYHKKEIKELLGGKILISHHWYESSDENAKKGLFMIARDMINVGISSKKFKEILDSIGYEDEKYV